MKEPKGKEWAGWCVEDGEIEYYIDIRDRQTSLISVMAPEWWDAANFLYKTARGQIKPLFTLNSPRLVKLIDKANEYFDAHNEELDPVTEQRIRQIVIRALRKRGIR